MTKLTLRTNKLVLFQEKFVVSYNLHVNTELIMSYVTMCLKPMCQ